MNDRQREVVAYNEKFKPEFYLSLFDGAPSLNPLKSYHADIPGADICEHVPRLEELASGVETLLELGPYAGHGSTLAFRRAAEKGRLKRWVSVDIVDHILPYLKPAWPGWSLVIGDSADPSTAEKVGKIIAPDKFDLIFVDTIHLYEHLKKELEVWSPLAHAKTTWLFHDTWIMDVLNPMVTAIEEFVERNPGWQYVDISQSCNGLGALVPVDNSPR